MKPTFVACLLLLIVSLLSCKNNSAYKDLPSLNDSTSYTGLTGDSVKLVKTASINFKVKDINQSTNDVSKLAQQFGGTVYTQNLISNEIGRKELRFTDDSLLIVSVTDAHASITARIPSQNLEAFLYSVGNLGYYVSSRQLQIDDRSLPYLENSLKQKLRNEVLSKPGRKKYDAAGLEQVIEKKDEVIDKDIANRMIDADVNYSVVNLELSQNAVVSKEIIADYTAANYDLSFGKQMMNALKEGSKYFAEFLLTLLRLWLFILTGIIGFLSYRLWQQKKKLLRIDAKAS